MLVRLVALLASVVVAAGDVRAQTAADSGHKSAVLAGTASYFFPGVGSWYAGNDAHARTHGAIALGFGFVAGAISIGGGCVELACEGSVANVGIGVVVLGYLTNAIWSTVTAVNDAHAHNERVDRQRTGRVDLTPTLHLAAESELPSRRRMELRLIRVRF